MSALPAPALVPPKKAPAVARQMNWISGDVEPAPPEQIDLELPFPDRTVYEDAVSILAAENGSQVLVHGFGVSLGKKSERLVVRLRGKPLVELPLHDLQHVHVVSKGVSLSSDLVQELGLRGVKLAFATRGGEPVAMLSSPTHSATVAVRRAQMAAEGNGRGMDLARAIVVGKLRNQEKLLRYFAKGQRKTDADRAGAPADRAAAGDGKAEAEAGAEGDAGAGAGADRGAGAKRGAGAGPDAGADPNRDADTDGAAQADGDGDGAETGTGPGDAETTGGPETGKPGAGPPEPEEPEVPEPAFARLELEVDVVIRGLPSQRDYGLYARTCTFSLAADLEDGAQSFEMTRQAVPDAPGQVIFTLSRETVGDEQRCNQIAIDLYLAEHSISVICDDVFAAAFRDIGESWACGQAEVYQERRGCEISLRVLHELRSFLPPAVTDAPVAIGGAASGDQYSLGTTMAELVLRDSGWNAVSLGDNLPLETLAAAIREQKPKLFWLSCSHIPDESAFRNQYRALYGEFGGDVAFVVGGYALTEQIRQHMTYAAYCDNMQHLEAFAQTLRNQLQ